VTWEEPDDCDEPDEDGAEADEDWEGPDDDWGALAGPCRPRSFGLASGGIRLEAFGTAAVRAELDEPACDFEPSVWPGAADDTSAAKPADSAAAPAIIHRLARDTRRTAASRSSAATDWARPAPWYWSLIIVTILHEEHHLSVRAA
jgi:hypothetical protein